MCLAGCLPHVLDFDFEPQKKFSQVGFIFKALNRGYSFKAPLSFINQVETRKNVLRYGRTDFDLPD